MENGSNSCVFIGRGWCATHKSWDCEPCTFGREEQKSAQVVNFPGEEIGTAKEFLETCGPEPERGVFTEPSRLIYVSGSMRNRQRILEVGKALIEIGYRAFVDWVFPGEDTDDKWQEAAHFLGQDYLTALDSPHAHDVYDFDRHWLDRSDALVMVAPAGRSAHVELGYMAGRGKPTAILMPQEDPERYDIMTLFADLRSKSLEEIVLWLHSRGL